MILDDVVSSFDAHKRPKLVDLLKDHFSDYQILLLTHDSIWRDRIHKDFPSWIRKHFVRNEITSGPIMHDGTTTIEDIRTHLKNDKPELAGPVLGPYLEGELQDLCEGFKAPVAYNKRNDYTLEPLLDAFLGRVQSVLTAAHPLYKACHEVKSESGFRNLCSHAKNPSSALTTPEMSRVVEKWAAVQALVRCPQPTCSRLLTNVDKGFACKCGQTVMAKPAATPAAK
jgi:hypothetical protein